MSYYETVQGMGKHGFTEGMGAAFSGAADRNRVPSEGLRSIQQNLQTMGLLQSGTGARGADGLWGPYTAAALGQARRRLARTAPAFLATNGGRLVTIPDDFIAAIQAAANAATEAAAAPATVASLPPGPDPSAVLPSTLHTWGLLPPLVEETSSPNTRLYLIGGSIAVVALGAAAYMLRPSKTTPKTTPNRRRHIRRRQKLH